MQENEEKSKKSINAEREEKILAFWQEQNTFQKSLTKEAPKGNYVFYDGPPFATGLPHYGHILGSTAKDVIGRYQTMQGFRVPRRWGWDCHGLPIENIVEKELGISGRKAIEEYGIDKFAEFARSKVLTYVEEWKKTVDRIGRWVDFDNSYKTMDNTFIESVWWALGELNKKGLIYEGVRVLAYCPRCETPIANSEIAMDNSYKDITDISVYVKFKILDENFTVPVSFLAWTTTPWTLPGNTAIAVNKDFDYVFVKNSIEKGEEILILEKSRYEILKDKFKNPEITKEVKGSELVGLKYEPLFPYYKNVDMENKENIWKVWHADFITADAGTGIAHEAPAFGEDDMNLAKANNIPFIRHVEPNGVFTKEVADFAGIKAKPKEDHQSTDVLIIKYLAGKGTLFAKEKIIHSYPHCYRCDTPLLYYALSSWFVNIQKVKNKILDTASEMNWIPNHLKDGRFRHNEENAPDWTISRNRYWASPLPIWKSSNGQVMFVNGLEDLKTKTKKSGNKYFFIRHGEAEQNVLGICSNLSTDPYKLTEKGKEQVILSAQKLKDKNIDIIISSPFLRTKETAAIVAKEINFPEENIILEESICELNWGEFDKKSFSSFMDVRDKYIGIGNFDVKIPGGESFQDAKNRISNFLYEIEKKYQNKNILLVGHGILLEMVPSITRGMNQEETFSDMGALRHAPGELLSVDFIPMPHNANYELDFHRPYIDSIVLVDESGEEYHRIPEVIDCWFESGSMPFAQDHYPFDFAQGKPYQGKDWQKENFPAGFVAEYIAQTRTWFYYTHAISTILFDHAPFKNVVTTGTILAEDGQKMSKSKNNFPDPWILFDKFGVDALRFYLMSSAVMRGEDTNFSEKIVQEISSKIVSRFDNVVAFYELYRDSSLESSTYNLAPSSNVLDQWILARLNQLVEEVTTNMEAYDMALATRPFELFIDDLSTWYLRRSRDRLKDGDKEAKATLYFVLKTTAKLLAPFTPFIAEDVWQRLRNDNETESVHLAEWPMVEVLGVSNEVLVEMQNARDIVTLGLKARQKVNIPVRQPLNQLIIKNYELKDEYTEIIKDELNIKTITENKNLENEVELDTNITPELKKEGQYRELVRAVQDMRKTEGLNPSDVITLSIATDNNGEEIINTWKEEFMKTTGVKEIKIGENDGTEIKIDELVFKIKIQK